MPAMQDAYFSKAVVYLLQHDSEGAFGLIINKPLATDLADLVQAQDDSSLDTKVFEGQQAVFGGPVNKEHGFVLHTAPFTWAHCLKNNHFAVTTSGDILEAICQRFGPENYLVSLGYSGWGPGQLEQEIKQNSWLTVEADRELLFGTDPYDKYELAIKKLGINPEMFTGEPGRA